MSDPTDREYEATHSWQMFIATPLDGQPPSDPPKGAIWWGEWFPFAAVDRQVFWRRPYYGTAVIVEEE